MVWLPQSSAVPTDMQSACTYACRMRTIQIRNVPDGLHKRIKARAALEGQSRSDYALSELRRAMEKPTRRELVERVASFERRVLREPAVEAVRAERDSR